MTHALQPTAFERGARSPDEILLDIAKRCGVYPDRSIPPAERARRRSLLEEALAHYHGSRAALSRAIGRKVEDRWLKDTRPVPEKVVARLEEVVLSPAPPEPRIKRSPGGDTGRRSGVIWCPGCARHLPESHMKIIEDGAVVMLERCKACKGTTRIANDRAQASAQHARHCQ